MLWMLLLQLLLIALNAVFACAEIAVLSVGEAKLERLAREGDRRAARLARLTAQPARFLATIQVAITLSGFLGSAFAADHFAGRLVTLALNLGASPVHTATLHAVAVVLITMLLSYLTLVFGELVPKRMAQRRAEKIALSMSALVLFISRLFAPLVFLLTVSTNGILRLFGIDPNENTSVVSEDDIRMMVDAGNKKGAIDNEEKEFIQNVFEFDDLTAGEIATHRTDVEMLWMEESMEEWNKTIYDSRHAIYPICRETPDDVVGLLNAKDYFRLESRDRESVMASCVRPAYFVPDGVKADVLFRNMKKTHNRFAIVLDEYGGMAGIVTINDLIERLVGNFSDNEEEARERENEIEALPDGTWRIRGTAALTDVEKELGIALESEDYDTFGGLVFAALGAIPEDGTTCEVETAGLHIFVTGITDHQMEEAIVTPLTPAEEEKEED